MSILLKKNLDQYLFALDNYYQQLRKALTGNTPIANTAHLHGFDDAAEFAEAYTDVNINELNLAIGHFKLQVEYLRHVKEHVITPTTKR